MVWAALLLMTAAAPDPVHTSGTTTAMPWIVAAVVAVAVGLGSGYFVSHRVNSGKVSTTDATTLWDESTKIRQELRTEVEQSRGEVAHLRGRVDELSVQIERVREKHVECQRSEAELRAMVESLQARMARARKATSMAPSRARKKP